MMLLTSMSMDWAQFGLGGAALGLLGLVLRMDHRRLVEELGRREAESRKREDALKDVLADVRASQAALTEVLRQNSEVIRENVALFHRISAQLEVARGK